MLNSWMGPTGLMLPHPRWASPEDTGDNLPGAASTENFIDTPLYPCVLEFSGTRNVPPEKMMGPRECPGPLGCLAVGQLMGQVL